MLSANPATADPLLAGFFSVPDATRLIRAGSANKVRGWLNGWHGSASGPIVKRDYEGSNAVSFLDLMELRFIEFFRGQGVTMQTLRKSAEMARREWDTGHPFALSKAKYMTDRRTVIAQVAEETGDKVTWELASGQLQMWEVIESAIAKGVVFDPQTDFAIKWHPNPDGSPNIVVDPRFAFGKPIIEGANVPTVALFNQWKAEGGDFDRVARWYNVSPDQVSEAVEYEIRMAA